MNRERRLRGFAASWFFAPYLGSADLDFFKRIKDTNAHYDVVQVKRQDKDERVLGFATKATFDRLEVVTDHRHPRTRKARDDFRDAALGRFTERKADYDFIISHSNEVPSHAVAWEAKKLAPHLPWIAYFGDVVSANPYVRHMAEYPLHDEDCATEAMTLRNADVVICNNEQQKRLMFEGELRPFADKAVVIPHCFDPAMYPQHPTPPRNERFTFVHLGTLYYVKRTAAPLFKGIDRLLEVYPAYRRRFEVVFYGGPYFDGDLFAQARMRNRTHVRMEGPVPYLDSLALMQQADALIIIDGIFDDEEDGLQVSPFFPCKLIDYAGARRPMFGITMSHGPTAELLQASGNLITDNRTDRIAYVLKQYIDGRVRHDESGFAAYECSAVGAQMERVIRQAIAGGGAAVPPEEPPAARSRAVADKLTSASRRLSRAARAVTSRRKS